MSKPTVLAAPTTKARAFGARAKTERASGSRPRSERGSLELARGWHERRDDRKAPVRADILAGITVAAVALPLNLALAVASGSRRSRG